MNLLPFRECGEAGPEFQTVLAEKSPANAAALYM